MNEQYKKRIEQDLKEAISEILKLNIQDKRLKFIIITGIDMAPDLKSAKVFYSTVGKDSEDIDKTELNKIITHAASFIKLKLPGYVDLRHIPHLGFFYDDIFEKGTRIEELIKRIDNDES